MTGTATEAERLEETWLEETVPCVLGYKCPREATWLLTLVCPCRKRRWPTCEPCREWLRNILAGDYYQMRCDVCLSVRLEVTWLPL